MTGRIQSHICFTREFRRRHVHNKLMKGTSANNLVKLSRRLLMYAHMYCSSVLLDLLRRLIHLTRVCFIKNSSATSQSAWLGLELHVNYVFHLLISFVLPMPGEFVFKIFIMQIYFKGI